MHVADAAAARRTHLDYAVDVDDLKQRLDARKAVPEPLQEAGEELPPEEEGQGLSQGESRDHQRPGGPEGKYSGREHDRRGGGDKDQRHEREPHDDDGADGRLVEVPFEMLDGGVLGEGGRMEMCTEERRFKSSVG